MKICKARFTRQQCGGKAQKALCILRFLRNFNSPRKPFRSVDAPTEKGAGERYPALRPSVSNHKKEWMKCCNTASDQSCNMGFALAGQQLHDGNINKCIASGSEPRRGAGARNQYLRRQRGVVDAHVETQSLIACQS